MGFLESYKRLERLCRDVMDDDRRVSAYIDEMVRLSDGSRRVSGWDRDLKQLKHYRWVRNQIVHDPDCSEENMCGPEDVRWIEDFHARIMNQTDPLALYRRVTQERESREQVRDTGPGGRLGERSGCLTVLACVGFVLVMLFL
jgi:hypothetical protein